MKELIKKKIADGAESDIFLLNDKVYDLKGFSKYKKYIAKVYHDKNPADIAIEFEVQNIAAKAGLAPKAVMHSDNYIIMEFVDGDLLEDLIENLGNDEDEDDEEEDDEYDDDEDDEYIGEYIDDPKIDEIVINGINKLHKLHILHGDLQPLNIIITKDGKIKFIDFSSSEYLPHKSMDYFDKKDQFVQMA